MKKKNIIFVAAMLFVNIIFAQNYKFDGIEKQVILPDGAVADITFFKKWGEANKMIKEIGNKVKSEGKKTAGIEVSLDSYLGYANIWHQVEGVKNIFGQIDDAITDINNLLYVEKTEKDKVVTEDNDAVKNIYDIMKASGVTYGIAYVNFEKRTRQYTFTYQKGRLRDSFFDYFDESHEFYQAYKNKDIDKQQKINDMMENEYIAYLSREKGIDSKDFKWELNRARQVSKKVVTYILGMPNESFVHLIYSDDGHCYTTNYPYLLIDEDGVYRVYDYNDGKAISVMKSEVPAEVLALVDKSSKNQLVNTNSKRNVNEQLKTGVPPSEDEVNKWYIKGEEFYELKQYEEAINAYTQVINLRLIQENIKEEKAKADSRNRDFYQFRRTWTGVEINAYLYRGKSYYRLKDYDSAIADYLVVKNNYDPSFYYIYVCLGDAYGGKGDYENTAANYKLYVEKMPSTETMTFTVDKSNPADMWFCAVLLEKKRLSGDEKYEKWLKDITNRNNVSLAEIEDFYKKNRGW